MATASTSLPPIELGRCRRGVRLQHRHDHVRDRLPFVFEDLGEQQVERIARPVRDYLVTSAGACPWQGTGGPQAAGTAAVHPAPALPLPDKPSIAVLPFANMRGDPEEERGRTSCWYRADIASKLDGIRRRVGIGENSSSIGASVASSASSGSRWGGLDDSAFHPSLRMIASSPGNSNSRGMRIAWFRPFLKSLPCAPAGSRPSFRRAYASYAICAI